MYIRMAIYLTYIKNIVLWNAKHQFRLIDKLQIKIYP